MIVTRAHIARAYETGRTHRHMLACEPCTLEAARARFPAWSGDQITAYRAGRNGFDNGTPDVVWPIDPIPTDAELQA